MKGTIVENQTADGSVKIAPPQNEAQRVLVLSGGFGGGTVTINVTCPISDTPVLLSGLSFTEAGAYPLSIPRGVPTVLTLTGATGASLNASVLGG